jgi:COMPASS component SWD3
MDKSKTRPRRRDPRAISPAESSSDELAAGSEHDEAERRRASWTIHKGFTPQRPQQQDRRYSESESTDELAVDANEYWRTSRTRRRSRSPVRPNRRVSESQESSEEPVDEDMESVNEQEAPGDAGAWSDRSATPVPPPPPPKPDHLNYKEKFVMRSHIRGVSAVQFSPDCTMIASAGMLHSNFPTAHSVD